MGSVIFIDFSTVLLSCGNNMSSSSLSASSLSELMLSVTGTLSVTWNSDKKCTQKRIRWFSLWENRDYRTDKYTTFEFELIGVMVVFPMWNDSPFNVTSFDCPSGVFLATVSNWGMMGLLSLTDIGPDNPGKHTMAKNQWLRSLIGITR